MSPEARKEFAEQLQAISERVTAIEARLARYEQQRRENADHEQRNPVPAMAERTALYRAVACER